MLEAFKPVILEPAPSNVVTDIVDGSLPLSTVPELMLEAFKPVNCEPTPLNPLLLIKPTELPASL